MPPKKKNHFVPQFYLRNFGKDDAISVFNIDRKLHIPTASIATQCQRDYLYGRTSDVENALQDLEGAAAGIIRKIIQDEEIPPKQSAEYTTLITFICFQLSRSPKDGEAAVSSMTAMFRAALRDSPDLPDHLKASLDGVEVAHDNPTLFQMAIAGKHAFALHDLKPVLIRNDSRIGFITSDSPAILFNQWAQDVKHRGVLGMICAGLQIFLPLSPTHMLALYDEGVYSTSARIRLLSENSVQGLNSLQLSENIDNLYFDGRPETLTAIHRLPFEWLIQTKTSHKVVEAESTEDSSKLIHLYQRIIGSLDIPEIRVRKRAKSTPMQQRGNSYRPLAKYALQLIERDSRLPPPPVKRGLFRAVREDSIEIE